MAEGDPREGRPDDAELDGCDIDFSEDPTPDDEVELFMLFAEALDPNNPKTIEDVEREWGVRS